MFAVLADDQDLVRESLSAVLATMFQFNVLQAKDAGEAVNLTRANNPVLVVLDLMMPGMDTFAAATQIRAMAPHTKVIILTGRADVDLVIRSRAIKVHGYVLKGDSTDEMRYAVNTVLRGGIYVPRSLSQHLLDPDRSTRSAIDGLTPKERTVLALIAKGMPMKQVAHHMDISVKTAETHRNNLGRKLGRPNKAQIFAFALEHRLIDTGALAISA